MSMIRDEQGRLIDPPVHEWFSLSYASYFVLPRLVMQEMPLDWQRRFVALMDEAAELNVPDLAYHVLPDNPELTHVARYDSEDETSRPYEFTALHEDPWANYRRGDAVELCPEFKSSKARL